MKKAITMLTAALLCLATLWGCGGEAELADVTTSATDSTTTELPASTSKNIADKRNARSPI